MPSTSRIGSTRSVRRPSFRDDMNLIAIRYEKTTQGEAPIPIPTRNPGRLSRPPTRPSTSSSSSTRSPIVIIPPQYAHQAPLLEQHPALRQGPTLSHDQWKRDSGHGGATCSSLSSTPTINEEVCETEFPAHPPLSPVSLVSLVSPVSPVAGIVQPVQDMDTCPPCTPLKSKMNDSDFVATPFPISPRSISRPGTASSIASQTRPQTSAGQALSSLSSSSITKSPRTRLFKSFSLRSRTESLLSEEVEEAKGEEEDLFLGGSGSGSGLSQAEQPLRRGGPSVVQAAVQTVLVQDLQAAQKWSQGTIQGMNPETSASSSTRQFLPPSPVSPSPPASPSRKKSPNSVTTFWKRSPFSPKSPKLSGPLSQTQSPPTTPSHPQSQPHPQLQPAASPSSLPMDEAEADDTLDALPVIFSPLSVSIPTESLLDDDFMTGLSFSNRGSIMFGGQRALHLDGLASDAASTPRSSDSMTMVTSSNPRSSNLLTMVSPTNLPSIDQVTMDGTIHSRYSTEDPDAQQTPNSPSITSEATPATRISIDTHGSECQTPEAALQQNPDEDEQMKESLTQSAPMPLPDIRVMPADIDRESQKVRSLYAVGDAIHWEDGAMSSLGERREPPIEEASAEEEAEDNDPSPARFSQATTEAHLSHAHLSQAISTPRSADSSSLRPDSYYTKDAKSAGGGYEDWDDLEGGQVDRYGFITEQPSRPVSSRLGSPTTLHSAQFSPRRRNVLQKRDPATGVRPPSRKVSARSLNTQHSGRSMSSLRSTRSVIRQASNLLPHNRDRKWMDEAGDMLTVAPSLQDIAEEARVAKISESLKRKEWERAEKWRKMAKNTKKGNLGEGMEFEFDVKNPKLIERTWKGIPDRWRAAAWWSFMAASAGSKADSATEREIIAAFHLLQERSSPDDVQIDLDVPRTISRHIMFRKRYTGGQRLLFRVLHALSIYFPETGYVQGMASLAATLLCYFDEEKCFVMLVRMWQLRGLDRLYGQGFEGLMTALKEFETTWLNKDVGVKLVELGIDPTAYGTRWYLTLFNLSIPFAAQLRVWDVFLLLGDIPDAPRPQSKSKKPAAIPAGHPTGLDILHATSAALIQALRELLLDSDFENAMKALTSFIPISDEELLMKVTKAEWKTHQGKKKA